MHAHYYPKEQLLNDSQCLLEQFLFIFLFLFFLFLFLHKFREFVFQLVVAADFFFLAVSLLRCARPGEFVHELTCMQRDCKFKWLFAVIKNQGEVSAGILLHFL